MTQRAEKQPTRFIRVTEVRRAPMGMGVHKMLQRAGLQGFERFNGQDATQQSPLSVEFPRKKRFGRLGRQEAKSVLQAIRAIGSQNDQGTGFHGNMWKVETVKVRKDGREKVKTLPKWPYGWEAKLRRMHKREVRVARKDEKFALKTDVLSSVAGRNPVRKALKGASVEEALIRAADKSEVVSGWGSWRARFRAKFAEGNPLRSAKFFLRPGQSRLETYGQIHSTMLQIADVQLDPVDKIHGPFEQGVKWLQGFQHGIGGALLTSVIGDIPFLNTIAARMVDVNKAASRDARAEFTARGALRVARRVGYIHWYGDFYNKKARKPGIRGWVNRFRFASDGLVEKATDRRMQRGNAAKWGKLEAIIRGNDWRTPLQRTHQKVVAQEFVHAYNAPAPILESFTHLGVTKVNGTNDRVAAIGQQVREKIEGMLPTALRRRVFEEQEDPRKAVKAAVEAYGGKPMSIGQQVEAIRAHVDAVLALPNLTKLETARWSIAKQTAERFASLYEDAQGVAAQEPDFSGRRTPAETPVAA